MAKERNTAKYYLKISNKLVRLEIGEVRRGITDRPLEEGEHQAEFPGAHIVKVGQRTTQEAALKWEREGGKK